MKKKKINGIEVLENNGIASGSNGFAFHQRVINGTQILVQANRLGEWYGYVNFIVKKQFDNEELAIDWLKNYPMADIE